MTGGWSTSPTKMDGENWSSSARRRRVWVNFIVAFQYHKGIIKRRERGFFHGQIVTGQGTMALK